MRITCCKDCPDRTVEPNCHITCPRYLKARAIQDAELKARSFEQDINGYQATVTAHIRKADDAARHKPRRK